MMLTAWKSLEMSRESLVGPRSRMFGMLAFTCLFSWPVVSEQASTVDLYSAEWSRNGDVVENLLIEEVGREGEGKRVRLPVDGTGVRWSTVFSTESPGTHRLFLSWDPGSTGLLFEILIDGERQPPPRDGWRPTSRHLVSDLGPRWLGEGKHLLEFIARENVEQGEMVIRSLELRSPEG